MTARYLAWHAMDEAPRRPGDDYQRQVCRSDLQVESNVYQRTVDYPGEWANGYHVMLDTDELVTVRWDQMETLIARVTKR